MHKIFENHIVFELIVSVFSDSTMSSQNISDKLISQSKVCPLFPFAKKRLFLGSLIAFVFEI